MKHLKLFILLTVVIVSLHSKGQQIYYEDSLRVVIEDIDTKVFHTQGDTLIVSNNKTSNKIFSDFNVYLLEQEFPAAESLFLQKVYRMVCDCNVEILMDTLKKHEAIFSVVERYGIPQLTGNKSILTNTNKIIISQNPFLKEILIDNLKSDYVNYELMNILGVRIKTGKLSANENRLNLSALKIGTYLLILTTKTNLTETYKIIKKEN